MQALAFDLSDISLPSASGSRLLSESSLDGADADLSVSELSITEHHQEPFSLLRPGHDRPLRVNQPPEEDEEDGEDGDRTQRQDTEEPASNRRAREEKLQNDLFILRKINATFAQFNEALSESDLVSKRVADQLEQTEALLNKYIDILSGTEQFARLIFDPQWLGAEEDERILMQRRREAAEKARREAEERALAQQRERERLEKEARERRDREEKERLEQERKERQAAARGSVRGVRGTRASAMRGMRGTAATGGIARGGSTAAARKASPSSTAAPTTSRGTMIPRGKG